MTIRTTIALGACLTLASLGATAHQITKVDGDVEANGDGYINVGGQVLKTGLGECLQTGTKSDDNTINACAGIEEEVVAEVEEKVVEEVAKAPEPAPKPIGKIDTRDFSEQALFGLNSAELSDDGVGVMTQLFAALEGYKGITGIKVVGHTDSSGDAAYNLQLSERRAATVAAEIQKKYPDARIEVEGKGETDPVASNDTREGRSRNRRVEIEVTAARVTYN